MEKPFWHLVVYVVFTDLRHYCLCRGLGRSGGPLASPSDLSSRYILCLGCPEEISQLIKVKLNGSWEQWLKRIYRLGSWCLYPFPLPLLVCKLFRAETLFALTFLQHVTNGALILAEVLGTTVKQINACFWPFFPCQMLPQPEKSSTVICPLP